MKHVVLYVGHMYKPFWTKKIWPGWQGGTLILTYLWFVQALGARCLWFYEKFWGVFWDYDTAQRHVFSSEAHGIGSSFAQRHSYQKCFKILKARGTESAQSLWCMEFYFISHNMSQWGWVILNHQLVNGSKSKGMTSAPSKSNVDRFINSSTSTVWACTRFAESSSVFCCSGLCTCFRWRFKLLLEVKVLEQIWHGRFWWSFLCWRSNLLFTKVFGFFCKLPPHTSSPHLWQHASSLCGPSDRPLSL